MMPELNAKHFDYDDLSHLNDWLMARGHKALEMSELPSVGFVISDDETRVAMCFLRRCEGHYGIIDGLCTNPDIPGPIRHIAIDAAVRLVIQEAENREITKLIAWTQDTATLKRGLQRHGFLQTQNILITKELTKPPQTH